MFNDAEPFEQKKSFKCVDGRRTDGRRTASQVTTIHVAHPEPLPLIYGQMVLFLCGYCDNLKLPWLLIARTVFQIPS